MCISCIFSDVRGPSTSTPDEDEMSPLKKVKTDIPETSGVQYVFCLNQFPYVQIKKVGKGG